jgi:hypothetical protein
MHNVSSLVSHQQVLENSLSMKIAGILEEMQLSYLMEIKIL